MASCKSLTAGSGYVGISWSQQNNGMKQKKAVMGSGLPYILCFDSSLANKL